MSTDCRRNVFISHAGEDSQVAADVARGLEEQGYSTWYFERDMVPGPSYLLQCYGAIEKCHSLLLVVSPHSISSHEVTKELELSHKQKRPILPILLNISHDEFEARQPAWIAILGLAASIELRDGNLCTVVDRLIQSLNASGIRPVRRAEPSIEFKPGPGQIGADSPKWATDASQIAIRDLKHVVFTNDTVDRFLHEKAKFFLSANKGLGKTLLLTFKRFLLAEEYQGGEAHYTSIRFVPENKPYVDFMERLPSLRDDQKQFLENLTNAEKLWAFALRVSAISHHPTLFSRETSPELSLFRPPRLLSWLRGESVAPTVVFKEVLALSISDTKRLLDRTQNFLSHKFRDLPMQLSVF